MHLDIPELDQLQLASRLYKENPANNSIDPSLLTPSTDGELINALGSVKTSTQVTLERNVSSINQKYFTFGQTNAPTHQPTQICECDSEFDKNWDLFEFLFRHHFVKPTSANLLSSLRGSAIDRLRTIDPLNTKSVEENIMALRTYYQDSPSIVLDRFSTYSRENKFKSLETLLLVFDIVKRRSQLPDDAAISFLGQALGCNLKEYLSLRCRKGITYDEYLDEVRHLEIVYTESKGTSLYLIKEPINGIFGVNKSPNFSLANANNPTFNVAGVSEGIQNKSAVCYSLVYPPSTQLECMHIVV
ncbi:hypothetical protein DICPUDRAFT_80544 [Dictyostelium purpureum]|uniref:Uncharacterized protein n=1 Tax=Dictyostelium purpureum TaxID=5786 RepID=F0ZQT1_DICPU|nr:uncharacterized protein DICPUDRAFT_80544 [Dictyostelium purpureum]EGC33693.1 hypothetical protein DICPUDRAFT_80544 [Dictyostelium purpureum]|eukprot:XP_003289770.1 hypothetical protein DICPUDRAFT_80544 [Dictyostelium purpureum]